MPGCVVGYFASIDVEVKHLGQNQFGKVISDAARQIEGNADFGSFASILIGIFLVVQLLAFARIFYKRSAGKVVLGVMIIVGVTSGPLSYALIDHAANLLDQSIYWECQLSLNAAYQGNSSPNYYKHYEAVILHKQLHTFFGAYVIGIHGFAAAWAANHALSRRLKTS
jgi:hypothetical protein